MAAGIDEEATVVRYALDEKAGRRRSCPVQSNRQSVNRWLCDTGTRAKYDSPRSQSLHNSTDMARLLAARPAFPTLPGCAVSPARLRARRGRAEMALRGDPDCRCIDRPRLCDSPNSRVCDAVVAPGRQRCASSRGTTRRVCPGLQPSVLYLLVSVRLASAPAEQSTSRACHAQQLSM